VNAQQEAQDLIRQHGPAGALQAAAARANTFAAVADHDSDFARALVVEAYCQGYLAAVGLNAARKVDALAAALYTAVSQEVAERDRAWPAGLSPVADATRGKLVLDKMGRHWRNRSNCTRWLFARLADRLLRILKGTE